MSRIRSIKPEFFSDEKVARLSRDCRLFFVGMWPVCCDDYGVSRAHPGYLKQVFPYDDDIGPKQIGRWLDELEDAGFISRFESGGERYLHIWGWHHQKVDHPAKARNPEPPDDLPRKSREPRETLDYDQDLGSRISTRTGDPSGPATSAPNGEKRPSAEKPPAELLRAAWNDAVAGSPLPSWEQTGPKRAKAVAAAWKWKPDLAWWRAVFVSAAADPWARGERPSPGHEGWKADIDFALRPDQAVKFSERQAVKPRAATRSVDNFGRALPRDMTEDEFRAYQREMKSTGVNV